MINKYGECFVSIFTICVLYLFSNLGKTSILTTYIHKGQNQHLTLLVALYAQLFLYSPTSFCLSCLCSRLVFFSYLHHPVLNTEATIFIKCRCHKSVLYIFYDGTIMTSKCTNAKYAMKEIFYCIGHTDIILFCKQPVLLTVL